MNLAAARHFFSPGGVKSKRLLIKGDQMKRILCSITMIAVLMSGILAIGARAEDEGSGGGEHKGKGEFAARMKEKLGLDDAQAKKLEEAIKANREALKPVAEKLKAAMKKLHEQLKSKAADKDIKATLDEIAAARKEMAGAREKMQGVAEATLTPTQRAKMQLAMMRMREGQGDRHGHGRHCGRERRHHHGDWGEGEGRHHDHDGWGGGEGRHHDRDGDKDDGDDKDGE